MTSKRKEKYFNWSDAWVFASLSGSADEEAREIDFKNLIAVGDLLDHSIMSAEEIKTGLLKLNRRGIVKVKGRSVRILPLATELTEKARKRRGGLFSVVDNCLAVLNSPRTKLPIIESEEKLEFIDTEFIRAVSKPYFSATHDPIANKVHKRK